MRQLSFRVPSLQPPPISFEIGNYLLGFLPSLDITTACPQARGFQVPASFRPQVLSTSRRLAPCRGFAGLFHPTAKSRTLPVQGFVHFTQPPILIGWSYLHAVEQTIRSPASRLPRNIRFDSEALIRVKPRAADSVISLTSGRSPLRVLLLLQVGSAPATAIPRG
jgi:hypothetical protein